MTTVEIVNQTTTTIVNGSTVDVTVIPETTTIQIVPGPTTFLGLADTPSSYSGQALKALRAKADETGLEFYTATPGGVTSVTASAPLASSGGSTPNITITDVPLLDASNTLSGALNIFEGHIGVGNFLSDSFYTPDFEALQIYEKFTALDANVYQNYGLDLEVVGEYPADVTPAPALIGMNFFVSSSHASGQGVNQVIGITGFAAKKDPFSSSDFYGVQGGQFFAQVSGASVQSDHVAGLYAQVQALSGGHAGTARGLWIDSPFVSGGTIDTAIGLEIGDQADYAIRTGLGAVLFGGALTAADVAISGTKVAHVALIGPASGSDAAPTWRALASADIPDLSLLYDVAGTASSAVATEATARASADSTHAALTTTAHGGIVASTDSRLTDARTPTAHASSHASAGSDAITIAESQVTNLATDLALKAPLASPTFTGTPAAPTAAGGTNTTQIATTAFVTAGFQSLGAAQTITTDTIPALLIQPVTSTVNPTLRLTALGAIGGAGGSADVQFYDNATLGFRFLGAFGNAAGSRYGGFIAGQDRDGNDLPIRFFTNNTSHAVTDAIFVGAGSAQGSVAIRSTLTSIGNGLYVPWKTGDTLPTGYFGSASASNAIDALQAVSGTGIGLRAVSGVLALEVRTDDAGTANIPNAFRIRHNTTGTPAAGFGVSNFMSGHSSTLATRDFASLSASWVDATDSTRKARLVLSALDTATREGLRIEASGTAPMLGFMGANASARTAITGKRSDATGFAALLTELATKGLITDSTTDTQVANAVYSGPTSGADAAPTFRALTPADLPVPSSYATFFDDFIFGVSLNTNTSGSGALAGVSTSAPDLGGHPGQVLLETGTTTAGRAGLYSGGGVAQVLFGNGALVWETDIYLMDAVSDGTDTYTIFAGFNDLANDNGVDSVMFRYTHGTNSGKFQAVTRSNSSETAADTGITVASTTWYKLRIEVNAAASSALFYINGVLKVTAALTIPSGTGRQTSPQIEIVKGLGTNSRRLAVDYVYAAITLSSAR